MAQKYYYNQSKESQLDLGFHRLRKYEGFYMFNGVWNLIFSGFFLLIAGVGYFTKTNAALQSSSQLESTREELIYKGIIFFIVFVIIGILNIKVTRKLNRRKSYKYIKIVAIINCFTGVLSLLLGVFTLIELNKPATIAEFEKGINPEKKPDYNRETFKS